MSSPPPPDALQRTLDGEDTVAAMGFVKQGLAVGGFLVWLVVFAKMIGSGRDVACSPRRLAAASGAGFQGAQSPWPLLGFSFGAFPLLSSGRGFLCSHGQTAIRKRREERGACTLTYSGREEERAPSIYRTGIFWCSATVARVRRSKAFL
jgi:hypothetical protein